MPDIRAKPAFVLKEAIDRGSREAQRLHDAIGRKIAVVQICVHVAASLIECDGPRKRRLAALQPRLLAERIGDQQHDLAQDAVGLRGRHITDVSGERKDAAGEITHCGQAWRERASMQRRGVGKHVAQQRARQKNRDMPARRALELHGLVEIDGEDAAFERRVLAFARIHKLAAGRGVEKHMEDDAACIVLGDPRDRPVLRDAVGVAVGEQEFAHGVAVDPAAKWPPVRIACRQEVDHADHAVAPRQKLLLDGQRANVEVLVRDFEPLGRIEGDGQILKVRLDSGHGVDRVVRW